VTARETPKRLDLFLANREPTLPRSTFQQLIAEGRISINAQTVKPSHVIKPGDRILLEIPGPESLELTPLSILLDIVCEDDALLFLNINAASSCSRRLGLLLLAHRSYHYSIGIVISIPPITSLILKSRLGLLGCALWQPMHA